MTTQLSMIGADDAVGTIPRLEDYDRIVVSSSGGKDSQAMLHYVARLAREAGVSDRVVVLHCDLGRMEWPGTLELVREQAAHYGFEVEVTSRIGRLSTGGKGYERGEVMGDLLHHVRRHGMWPGGNSRYCTSDHKRGPSEVMFTELARQWREDTGERRAYRILDCMGMRAQESPKRAEKPQFEVRKDNGNQRVDTWLPIQAWTVDRVWETIRSSGVRHHWAYDLGMPRLSCVFCVFASRDALRIAGRANTPLLREYVAVEREIDHTFQKGRSLASVLEEIERGDAPPTAASDWAA